MSDYIERDAAMCFNFSISVPIDKKIQVRDAVQNTMKAIVAHIEAIPAADVVEVVRCKDCKWYQLTEDGDMACVKDADEHDGTYFGFIQGTAPEWFCADGKRKGGAEDEAD